MHVDDPYEKIRYLQRQLALSELKVAEAIEVAEGLQKNLAIAIKVLKDLSSDYGMGSNGHNLIWDTIEGMESKYV